MFFIKKVPVFLPFLSLVLFPALGQAGERYNFNFDPKIHGNTVLDTEVKIDNFVAPKLQNKPINVVRDSGVHEGGETKYAIFRNPDLNDGFRSIVLLNNGTDLDEREVLLTQFRCQQASKNCIIISAQNFTDAKNFSLKLWQK